MFLVQRHEQAQWHGVLKSESQLLYPLPRPVLAGSVNTSLQFVNCDGSITTYLGCRLNLLEDVITHCASGFYTENLLLGVQ